MSVTAARVVISQAITSSGDEDIADTNQNNKNVLTFLSLTNETAGAAVATISDDGVSPAGLDFPIAVPAHSTVALNFNPGLQVTGQLNIAAASANLSALVGIL